MKNIFLIVLSITVFVISGCAGTQVKTKADDTSGGIYTGEDTRYKVTALMEFYKRTNKSISHNSDLAMVVGSEISNALKDINVNIAFPSVVASEFTSRGEINMIREGVRIARLENKDLVLFLDVQINKRGRASGGKRLVEVSIDAWAIDVKQEKIIFKLSKKGDKTLRQDAGKSAIDRAVREAAIETANELGTETSRLLSRYLSVA